MNNSTGRSSENAYDVFLCHNSQDQPEVRQINEAPKAGGLKPWFDEVDLHRGDRWRPAGLSEPELGRPSDVMLAVL